jgi:methylenetetrahydrofolate--tRNA-(uracil-5-)-methyltransferase
MRNKTVHIVGAGLAGSEAAWQLAQSNINVILYEMRPVQKTAAHKTDNFAELVCSNSFRSDDCYSSAIGLLHEEMRQCGSIILQEGDKAALPAGSALAVDRDVFSQNITHKLLEHPNIEIRREAINSYPPEEWEHVIICTGPLTSEPLAEAIRSITGEDHLAFFDAIAPIVYKDSINFDIAWFQSRYDKLGPHGTGKDYINCPLDKEQYENFIEALLNSDKTEFKDWEKDTPYFEGCMPIEVMASRGTETLRYGPMKPVGLTNPHDNSRPYAVVQLRQDNKLGSLYNIVGFQTKMKYGEQTKIFKMIPGLEDATFARLGGLHRNTFINSPKLLSNTLQLKADNRIRFAGQITGCEGYIESAAVGMMAAWFMISDIKNISYQPPPQSTALGALLSHITGGAYEDTFQPMNINFGLFPNLSDSLAYREFEDKNGRIKKKRLKGKDKKEALAKRALEDLNKWKDSDHNKLAA